MSKLEIISQFICRSLKTMPWLAELSSGLHTSSSLVRGNNTGLDVLFAAS